MKRVVSIAEMIVSSDPDDLLITYALGPCLGVAVWDVVAGVGGLIHCQLPSSKAATERADFRPAQFVDTGVTALLESMFELGADKRRITIKVAGAAQVLDNLNVFKIAERNYTVLRKLLWKNGLLIHAEDVGGSAARTMSLEIGSGRVVLQSGDREWELGESAAGVRSTGGRVSLTG